MPTTRPLRFHPPAVAPTTTWVAEDASILSLRPVQPGDTARIRAFIENLSYSARYFRFGCGEPHFSDAQVRRLCDPDTSVCADFVVVRRSGGHDTVVASARYCVQADGTSCEFAIAVADDWQGHGLGRQLLAALFERARSSGLTLIYGRILATNTRMLEFSRRNGFEVRAEPANPAIRTVSRSLGRSAPDQPHAAAPATPD
ncbi:MAG: GNAT family N-acetyltransferase [Zoogloeaceae bacterium]|nr:GNAT family N-acetyltransferase [Rhodocyclaceae bacterium]MCP5233788.1 GNAT family N-acetyltransferase [Zoogloeaceae bacterium]MCP5252841.1 GNAT family N-acetyltransferase [Zoogloeaceae bacterium]MCP5293107.1 GNAT family N-acetyltransferase [Zoogloeaceae bacterium]MCW5617054.1 GNAT family N-acetyltransferase [Rhodocyclaceae bacterium]